MTNLAASIVLVLAQPAAGAPGAAVAMPVEDVLVRLVEMHRSGDTTASAVLHLDGGTRIEGRVVDLAGAGAHATVLVHGSALHYVSAASIVSIAVAAPDASQRLAAPSGRLLSKVDVQRRVEELARIASDALGGGRPLKVEIVWKGLPESGEGLALVASAVEEALGGVRDAASDDASRRDLARRLERVRIAEAPRAGASFSGAVLTVGVAPSAGAAGRASALEVRRALQR